MHQHTPFQARSALPAWPAPHTATRAALRRIDRPYPAPVIQPWPRAVRLGVLALGGCLGWALPFALALALRGSGLG